MTVEAGGRELVGQGREAEIIAWGEGRVLRLMWNPQRRPVLEREAVAMKAARAAGAPAPEVGEVLEVAGRPGLVMERVDGRDLLTLLGRRPWTILRTARACGRLHARLHETPAPSDLPPLRALLEEQLSSSPAVPDGLRSVALDDLSRLPDGESVCHGDFHPGNVLLGSRGPMIVDWTGACRGDPAADVARSLLLLRLGELPSEAPLIVRGLARVGRRLLSRGYLRSYRRIRAIDVQRLRAWNPVLLAVRLAEGIEAERPALLDLLASERLTASTAPVKVGSSTSYF